MMGTLVSNHSRSANDAVASTSTGGKVSLGSISKMCNRYLRHLLVVGAYSFTRRAKQLGYTRRPWLVRLRVRYRAKPPCQHGAVYKGRLEAIACQQHRTSDRPLWRECEKIGLRHPRPTKGIFVAMTVMVRMFTSSGNPAM